MFYKTVLRINKFIGDYENSVKIESVAQRLQRHASEPLQQFTEYVNDTWINGTWGPSDWTAFKKAIRTNNDVEGWHNSLNRRASGRGQLPMYLLIKFLHKEATLTALQIRLVSEKKLKRIQRRKYRELQAKLFELWDQYEAKERSAKSLLKALYAPTLMDQGKFKVDKFNSRFSI